MQVLRIRNNENSPWEEISALVGPQGKSAYEIAVEHGFTGTEEEWLESLKQISYNDISDKPTLEGVTIEGEKGFGCTNWKNGCNYTIWKNDKFIEAMGKKVTKEMVELLLKNGKVGFRNLKSKKGNTFSAYFRYERNEQTGYFNWKIEFI